MAEPDPYTYSRRPTAALPLLGMTVFLVEDSRFAAEALRLICLRAGARLRRAESLAQAGRHLGLYRPDCMIVDCGLPDGDGCGLIARLSRSRLRPPLLLGTSGDEEQRRRVMEAGADGFLGKPLPRLPQMLRLLQPRTRLGGTELPLTSLPEPDPLALQDDLHHALTLIAQGDESAAYVAGFVQGIAAQTGDRTLALAAARWRADPATDLLLRALIVERIACPLAPASGAQRPDLPALLDLTAADADRSQATGPGRQHPRWPQ